jgi:SAM-dependent methyltransferase
LEFSKISLDAVVANIGSGGMIEVRLRHWAKKTGFVIHSMDIDQARMPDFVVDITKPNLPPNTYDVIVMAEVLEHVTDPQAAVKGINHLLKPSGLLILTVPFIFPIHDRPYDYFRYTKYGLQLLFRGMSNLTIKEKNSWAEAINVLLARLIMEKSVSARLASPIAVTLAILIMPLAYMLGRLIKTDFMTTGYLLTCNKSD